MVLRNLTLDDWGLIEEGSPCLVLIKRGFGMFMEETYVPQKSLVMVSKRNLHMQWLSLYLGEPGAGDI